MSPFKYHEAAALLSITALSVHFTDIMYPGEKDGEEGIVLSWTTALLFVSSISPWNISRVLLLFCDLKASDNEEKCPSTTEERQFVVYQLVHDLSGAGFHLLQRQSFVWVAIVNYPLMYAHLDRALTAREGSMKTKKDNSSLSPLMVVGIAVFICGIGLRGSRFLLSGPGVVALAVSLTTHRVAFAVVARHAIPLGLLFVLEHCTIFHGMDLLHCAVHTVSHLAIHRATNDLYRHSLSR